MVNKQSIICVKLLFLHNIAVDELGVPHGECIVFEDAQAGIDAASVAVGRPLRRCILMI